MAHGAFCVLFVCSVLAGLMHAQSMYSLSGSVLNSQTGEPVGGALATLSILNLASVNNQANRPKPIVREAAADSTGRFQFDNLPEGSYMLTADRPGFWPGFTSGDLHGNASNLAVRISPLGVIAGKVRDQYGEPVMGVNVVAMSVQVLDGRRTLNASRTAISNDLGAFRIWDLSPRKYYVKAKGTSGRPFEEGESFAPVYTGGAEDFNSAQPITIAPGTNATADISVVLQPAVKIKSELRNFVPYKGAKFELLRGSEDPVLARSSVNPTTGAFEIQDVVPGAYKLRVTQDLAEKMTRAELPITAKQTDLEDVILTLLPGLTVSASTHGPAFSGTTVCNMILYPTTLESAPPILLSGGASPQATDVMPGTYFVYAKCTGSPTSMISGSTDLMANHYWTILPGVVPPPIEVTVAEGGGTITAKIAVEESAADITTMSGALLVPLFPTVAGPQLTPLALFGSPQRGISFSLIGLAPGDYTLYLLRDGNVEYRDPAYLQSLTGGTPVRVEENSTTQVTLSVK